MSVTGISAAVDPYQVNSVERSPFQKVRSDFEQFREALASGTLDQARQAFSALQNDLPSDASGGPIGQTLSAVGQALQAGDLSSAQQSFAALEQQVRSQGAHRHHHHHHHQNVDASNSSSSSPLVAGDPTGDVGTLVNVSV